MNLCVFCGHETEGSKYGDEPGVVYWKCPACKARALGMTRADDERLIDEHCYDTGYTKELWTAICPEGCLYIPAEVPV